MGKPSSRTGKTPVWGSESIRSALCYVLRSDCTTNLVLQMSKATGWEYYMGITGMNCICQDLCAHCCRLLPWLHHSQISSDWALQIPLQFPGCEIRVVVPTKWPTMLGALVVPMEFSFPIKGVETQGRPLSVVLCWAGGRGNGSGGSFFSCTSNIVCLNLCKAGYGDASTSPPLSRTLSVVSCSWRVVSCSCKRKQSQERPMLPSWWHSPVMVSLMRELAFFFFFPSPSEKRIFKSQTLVFPWPKGEFRSLYFGCCNVL